MRESNASEVGSVTSNAHVTNHKMCHGNPRGRNQQTIVYRYMSAEVASVVKTFRGNKLESTVYYVNPLFVGKPAAEAYELHLKG